MNTLNKKYAVFTKSPEQAITIAYDADNGGELVSYEFALKYADGAWFPGSVYEAANAGYNPPFDDALCFLPAEAVDWVNRAKKAASDSPDTACFTKSKTNDIFIVAVTRDLSEIEVACTGTIGNLVVSTKFDITFVGTIWRKGGIALEKIKNNPPMTASGIISDLPKSAADWAIRALKAVENDPSLLDNEDIKTRTLYDVLAEKDGSAAEITCFLSEGAKITAIQFVVSFKNGKWAQGGFGGSEIDDGPPIAGEGEMGKLNPLAEYWARRALKTVEENPALVSK